MILLIWMNGRFEMSLKEDFNKVVVDIRDIKADISTIKEDLAHHIKRTALLETKQDLFEAKMTSFEASSKNIETASLIIQKTYKPFLVIVAVASSSVAFPNLAAALQQISAMC